MGQCPIWYANQKKRDEILTDLNKRYPQMMQAWSALWV